MERVAADEDRASGPSHVGAEFVHLMAGRFSGDPAGMPGAGGDAAVQRHGEFQHDVRAFRGLPDQKIGDQIPAQIPAYARFHFHARFGKAFHAARRLGVGIAQADDHVTDARRDHRFRAGRGLPLMVAGLQRDDQGAGRGIDAFGFCVLEALHFRMALAVSGMPASGNDNTVTDKYGAHRRIGSGGPAAAFREFDGFPHERFVRMAHAPSPEGPVCPQPSGVGRRGRSSSVMSASFSICMASSSG